MTTEEAIEGPPPRAPKVPLTAPQTVGACLALLILLGATAAAFGGAAAIAVTAYRWVLGWLS